MTIVLAVDLAAKYSAACLMDHHARVLAEADSWGVSENDFLDELEALWIHSDDPALMAVEDLPHRLPFASLVKRVCRIQGRIVERMDVVNALDALLFVPPGEWRKAYPGLKRGTGPDAVVDVAAAFGYTAPDFTARITKAGDRAIARKVATDHCAAYLIARWVVGRYEELGTFAIPGTSRYTDPVGRWTAARHTPVKAAS